MSVLYFANVGNRDVKHTQVNQVIPRLSGQEWLKNYDQVRDYLEFPILRNGLEFALRELNGRVIDRLTLFYTDQPATISEKYRNTDTLYFAELVKRLIAERLGDKIVSSELIPITGAPNDYDDMYQYYSASLELINSREKIEMAFFAPAGGTPACNMTMVLHGSRIFQQNSQVILISEAPYTLPKSLNISAEIIRSHNRRALEKMLENYNFEGAANLLAENSSGQNRKLLEIARSACARLALDYREALRRLEEPGVAELFPDTVCYRGVAKSLHQLDQQVEPLHSKAPQGVKKKYLDLRQLQICEVALTARIKYLTGQYTDFTGRIFRIQEGLTRWFFEYYTGYSTNIQKKFPFRKDFENYTRTTFGKRFIEYLRKKENKDYHFEPNRVILTKFWDFCRKQNSPDSTELYPQLLDLCKRIDGLSDLRNESSLAHGFAAITRDIIQEKYHKGDVFEDIGQLPDWFRIPWNLKIYELLRSIILKHY